MIDRLRLLLNRQNPLQKHQSLTSSPIDPCHWVTFVHTERNIFHHEDCLIQSVRVGIGKRGSLTGFVKTPGNWEALPVPKKDDNT